MNRAIKLSLKFLTKSKRVALEAVVRELRATTNFYCRSLWATRGKLDAATLKRYTGGSLGYRQKAEALKMALETVIATRKAAKVAGRRASCPRIQGAIRLGSLTCKIEPFKGSGFDHCAKISGLIPGHPIIVPLKGHKWLNRWLVRPGARLLDGCVLAEDYIAVYVEIPDSDPKQTGEDIGIDTGYRKMMADSNGHFYGTDYPEIVARVRRKKPGSKGKRRAQAFRHDEINRHVKSLPWKRMKMIAVEDLTGLKLRTQQKDKSSKRSRKTMAPWVYRQVLDRIEQLAPEHRVRLVYVDPRNTSRRCPSCGWVAKENRIAEVFRCVRCNYTADADLVGAVNILTKAIGNWQESMVPASSA